MYVQHNVDKSLSVSSITVFSIPCTFVSMRINKGVQHEFGNHVCSRVAQGITGPYLINFDFLCIINKGNTS